MVRWSVLALAGVCVVSPIRAGIYADSVVQYNPVVGYEDGYVSPEAALGEPSRLTVDPVYGTSAVDPFNPPYLSSQVVSIGAGGSLTLKFSTPMARDASHPYSLDFLVFGDAGLGVQDYNDPDWKADGTLFGTANAATRVSVSRDGVTFYTLNPSLCPVLDNLYPADGAGDFQKPVNPSLAAAGFMGKDLADIRALYAGSGGGAGFSLGWAQDGNGQSVNLPDVSYVKVDVLSQKIEIDGIVAVPEPAAWTLCFGGLGLAWCLRQRK